MKKVVIVTLNGLGGSGKSTFAHLCKTQVKKDNEIHVFELSMVDYVKYIATYCGWGGGKSDKDRVFLSDLKKALEKWNNSPFRDVTDRIKAIATSTKEDDVIIFVNAREPNDIMALQDFCKENNFIYKSVFVTNPRIESNEVPELIPGIMATTAKSIEISNDGSIKDLCRKAYNFVQEVLSGE